MKWGTYFAKHASFLSCINMIFKQVLVNINKMYGSMGMSNSCLWFTETGERGEEETGGHCQHIINNESTFHGAKWRKKDKYII